jgi:hypothetical protein
MTAAATSRGTLRRARLSSVAAAAGATGVCLAFAGLQVGLLAWWLREVSVGDEHWSVDGGRSIRIA